MENNNNNQSGGGGPSKENNLALEKQAALEVCLHVCVVLESV